MDEAGQDPVKYNNFFRRFGNFFKEGACNNAADNVYPQYSH
jgi:hypothetical protein